MAIRRRGDRWYFRTTVTLPDGSRRRVAGSPGYAGPYADLPRSKVGAQEAERRAIATHMTEAPKTRRACPTLDEYAETFLKTYKPSMKPSAKHAKRQIVTSCLRPMLGHLRLDAIRQVDVDTLARGMLDAGLAAKTVRNRLGVLSSMLKYAAANGLCPPPTMRFSVRGASAEIEAVSEEDLCKLLDACDDPVLRCAVLLAADAGLRCGELRGLQWGDVEAEQLCVRRAIDVRNNVGAPKHDKIRRVPTSPRLRAAIAQCPKRGLFVISRGDGRFVGYYSFLEELHAAYARAKVDPPLLPLHCLRHRFGSHLASTGVPLPVVRDLMGHSSISTTMRYVTITSKQLRDAIDLAFGDRS